MSETMTWFSPDGTNSSMNSNGMRVLHGPSGLYSPTARIEATTSPGTAGAIVEAVVDEIVTVEVPVEILAPTPALFRHTMRFWTRLLDPTKGHGRLRVQTATGDTPRELLCYCVEGMQGDDSRLHGGLRSWTTVLVFKAFHPYWLATSDTIISWVPGDTRNFFPLFPLTLGASSVGGTQIVNVVGDVEVWPVITVQGPGTDISIGNDSLNREIAWSGTLTLNESLVIDTRPPSLSATPTSVTVNGVNRFSELTAWDFWPIQPGTSIIDGQVSGADETTSISLRWRSRYRSV